MAFKSSFFFTSLVAELQLTNLIAATHWKESSTENSSNEARGNGSYWIYMLSQIEITAWSDFHTSAAGYPLLSTAGSFPQRTVLLESICFSRK